MSGVAAAFARLNYHPFAEAKFGQIALRFAGALGREDEIIPTAYYRDITEIAEGGCVTASNPLFYMVTPTRIELVFQP